jgi:hypothetical protein
VASPSADVGEVVAYVENDFIPHGARLADIVHIKRHAKWLNITGSSIDLMVADEIYVVRPDAAIIVRMLADNEFIPVRKTTKAEVADFVVRKVALPGLQGKMLVWMKDVLLGANRASSQNGVAASVADNRIEVAASRAVNTGPCYNETGKTNEPVTFRIPILAASRSVLAAGNRAIFISWQGGAPPFSVTLSDAETGRILAQTAGVGNTCAAYLPRADLRPGRYRLTLTDAQNVKEQEDSLFVVDEAPAEPRELRDANLPDEARQIYAATWLAVLDHGTWAFEAQQRVAAMDCRSAAVEDWLRQWGSSTPCAEAKR